MAASARCPAVAQRQHCYCDLAGDSLVVSAPGAASSPTIARQNHAAPLQLTKLPPIADQAPLSAAKTWPQPPPSVDELLQAAPSKKQIVILPSTSLFHCLQPLP